MTHHQLTLTDIKRIFEDFLIVTGIKQYNHTSAAHTALLYEYVAARLENLVYPLSQYIAIMRRINLYAINASRAYKVGEPHTKAYCLWLKGLPKLVVDEKAEKPKAEYVWTHKKTGKKKSGSKWYNTGTKNHRLHRSKTPTGLATAMAEQWG